MEVEKKFAKALHIPVKTHEALKLDKSNKNDNANIIKPVLANPKIYMWRVMFYFDYINRNGSFALQVQILNWGMITTFNSNSQII